MTYNTPLPTGHDDFMNALAEDWHEYGEPDPYIASLVRAANEAAQRAARPAPATGPALGFAEVDEDDCDAPVCLYRRYYALTGPVGAGEPAEVEELGA